MTQPKVSYELHGSFPTLATIVHWALIDLELSHSIPHTVHKYASRSEAQTPAYRQINPKGKFPTLLVDGKPVTETIAILMLLAERHPEAKIAPPPGSAQRSEYLETMVFLANFMLPHLRGWHYAETDGASNPEVMLDFSAKKLAEGWEFLNNQMEGRKFALGEEISVVDYVVVLCARYTRNCKSKAEGMSWNNVKRVVDLMSARESCKVLHEREGISWWPKPTQGSAL